jgi:hypothetical protein
VREKMKLLLLIATIFACGCQQKQPPATTRTSRVTEVMIIDQFGTNTIPVDSWTKTEKIIFHNTNTLMTFAFYAETNGAFSVSQGEESQLSWKILEIKEPTIILKREGLSKR